MKRKNDMTIPINTVDSILELMSMIIDAMNNKTNFFILDDLLKLIIKSKPHEIRLFFKFISFLSEHFEVYFMINDLLWDVDQIKLWR